MQEDQNRQGQYADVEQIEGSSPGEALMRVTTRIEAKCRWYMWLVGFLLGMSILNLGISIFTVNQVQGGVLMILLSIVIFLFMLVGFPLALEAKRALDKSMQYMLFVLFIIMTIASFGFVAMTVVLTGWLLILVIPLCIQGFIGLFLIVASYFLCRLMRDRDNLTMQLNTIGVL